MPRVDPAFDFAVLEDESLAKVLPAFDSWDFEGLDEDFDDFAMGVLLQQLCHRDDETRGVVASNHAHLIWTCLLATGLVRPVLVMTVAAASDSVSGQRRPRRPGKLSR